MTGGLNSVPGSVLDVLLFSRGLKSPDGVVDPAVYIPAMLWK